MRHNVPYNKTILLQTVKGLLEEYRHFQLNISKRNKLKNFSEFIKMQYFQPLYTTNKLKVKRLDVHSFLNCCYITSSTRITLHKYLKQCQHKANEAPSRQLEAKNDRRTVEALQFMSTRTKTSSCERSRG